MKIILKHRAVFHHEFHFFQLTDVLHWVRADGDNVRICAFGNHTEFSLAAEHLCGT